MLPRPMGLLRRLSLVRRRPPARSMRRRLLARVACSSRRGRLCISINESRSGWSRAKRRRAPSRCVDPQQITGKRISSYQQICCNLALAECSRRRLLTRIACSSRRGRLCNSTDESCSRRLHARQRYAPSRCVGLQGIRLLRSSTAYQHICCDLAWLSAAYGSSRRGRLRLSTEVPSHKH